MYNERRFIEMVEDAKRRRDQRRQEELDEFAASVRAKLGDELSDMLELKFTLDGAGGEPEATFRIGAAEWYITRNPKGEADAPGHWLLIGPSDGTTPFDEADEVLLAIDEADKA